MVTDAELPQKPAGASESERWVDVPGGRVFVKIVRSEADDIPLLCLHGGPGFPSYYLEPLAALADVRPVILFDQLGCGRSDRPEDESLWTLERFVVELDAVMTACGFPLYHLYGHSWGALLATRYATTFGTTRIASLILSSPIIRADWWERDCAALIEELEPRHRGAIKDANASGCFDGEEFLAAQHAFYDKHVCKYGSETELFQKTIAEAGYSVYNRIQGPNEFTLTGTMKGWDLSPELERLRVPVLFMAGEFDEALPSTLDVFAAMTPDAQVAIIPDAAHLTMLDAADASNRRVVMFLEGVKHREAVPGLAR